MARYDKYEPYANGFRALLKLDFIDPAKYKVPFGVGLDADGLVVVGNGNTGIVGILILTEHRDAGDVVDVMTGGEVVNFGGVAGTKYFADPTTGVINTTSAAGKTPVGFTAEATRLIVRRGAVVAA